MLWRHGEALTSAFLVLLQDQLLELLPHLASDDLRLQLHVDLLPRALGGHAGHAADGVRGAKALAAVHEHQSAVTEKIDSNVRQKNMDAN